MSRDFSDGESVIHVVRNCTLSVSSGEIVAIVGKSGSGKSTLCNLLSGLDTPTSGSVSLLGRNLTDYTDAEMSRIRAAQIGFVLQKDNLVTSLTLEENVAAPLIFAGTKRSEALRAARAMLDDVGLGHRLSAWPTSVSGGEAQRAAVARACVGKPAVVFADEPTGALDSENGRIVMDLFKKLVGQHESAGVMVTHDMDLAAEADRVVRLVDGTLEDVEVGV
ncbi:ABC transporter ATP-binding protein [Nocardia cyriacigeorgica]|uniref:ABC transporter ATP-binding protein n=1 Tax=Nocardia cyriacigeorgica TaxID=135487 RepID=UPI002B4B41D5|nr:ABC transporter ATP-binding protein [Nocardia cyriacigeorgica]